MNSSRKRLKKTRDETPLAKVSDDEIIELPQQQKRMQRKEVFQRLIKQKKQIQRRRSNIEK